MPSASRRGPFERDAGAWPWGNEHRRRPNPSPVERGAASKAGQARSPWSGKGRSHRAFDLVPAVERQPCWGARAIRFTPSISDIESGTASRSWTRMKQQPRFSSAPVRNRVPRPPGRAAQFVTDRVVLLAQQQENSPDWRVGTGDVRLDKRVRQRGGRAPLADKWSLTRGSWPGSRGGGSRDQDATGAATDSGGGTARTWPVSQSMAASKSGRPAGMTGFNAPPTPTPTFQFLNLPPATRGTLDWTGYATRASRNRRVGALQGGRTLSGGTARRRWTIWRRGQRAAAGKSI